MTRDKEHGADGAHVNSTRYRIMTEGTPEEQRALEKWLDEAAADARSMDDWARAGGTPWGESDEREAAHEQADRDILTPDVDEYLRRRGYKPEAEDDE